MSEINTPIYSIVSAEETRVLKELEEFLHYDVLVYNPDTLKECLNNAKKLEGKIELLIKGLKDGERKRKWKERRASLELKITEIESRYYSMN